MTKYTIKSTGQFKKDFKLAKKQHKDINSLKQTINKLANGETLPPQYKDHPLSGNWKGYRECHIEPDWLLIYYYDDNILVLTLTRVGTHSELFE